MLTVLLILAVAALITTIMSMAGKCPLSVPVILMAIYLCLLQIPRG